MQWQKVQILEAPTEPQTPEVLTAPPQAPEETGATANPRTESGACRPNPSGTDLNSPVGSPSNRRVRKRGTRLGQKGNWR